jgi:hypothetical protein
MEGRPLGHGPGGEGFKENFVYLFAFYVSNAGILITLSYLAVFKAVFVNV